RLALTVFEELEIRCLQVVHRLSASVGGNDVDRDELDARPERRLGGHDAAGRDDECDDPHGTIIMSLPDAHTPGSETFRGHPEPLSADYARKRAREAGIRPGRS